MLDATNPGDLKVCGVPTGVAGVSNAAASAAEQLPCEPGALALAHDSREFLTVKEV